MADEATTKTVFFTMVLHSTRGWIRCGPAYGSRAVAMSWLPFMRKVWRGLKGRVSQCAVDFVGGSVTSKSARVLDKKYNMATNGRDAKNGN